jgi:hypothetical protein
MPNSEPIKKENLDVERLQFEHEQLRLERQKLAIETHLKRRELRKGDKKTLLDRLTNPLSLAILAGFITLMTTLITSYSAKENAASDERRARQTLEADLIKKFVEGPAETVRANLQFLVDANFLPDYASGITEYLKNNPAGAPLVRPSKE